MTVYDLLTVMSGRRYKIRSASSGKTLASSWTNKRKYLETFYTKKVSCIVPSMVLDCSGEEAYPVLTIYIVE